VSESIDRDEVIRLLERLGSDDDADVLAAARALHAHVSETDLEWDDLLASDRADAATDDADDDDNAARPDPGVGGRDGDTLALIEELLSKHGGSQPLREELEEYKADIANGEFQSRDHQYVRALYKRLIG